MAVFKAFNGNGVVKIAGVFAVNREKALRPQIKARPQLFAGNRVWEGVRFFERVRRKFSRQMMRLDDDFLINPLRLRIAENLDDLAVRVVVMLVVPQNLRHDDLTRLGVQPVRLINIDLVRQFHVFRDDKAVLPVMLIRADDAGLTALKNLCDFAFRRLAGG